MKLTDKIILIIVLTVTTIISVIFYVMALRFETQMERQLLMTARSVYKNILTMRRWVAEYNGVYVEKPPGVKSNPYLPFPERITVEGDTLTKKKSCTCNPGNERIGW